MIVKNPAMTTPKILVVGRREQDVRLILLQEIQETVTATQIIQKLPILPVHRRTTDTHLSREHSGNLPVPTPLLEVPLTEAEETWISRRRSTKGSPLFSLGVPKIVSTMLRLLTAARGVLLLPFAVLLALSRGLRERVSTSQTSSEAGDEVEEEEVC